MQAVRLVVCYLAGGSSELSWRYHAWALPGWQPPVVTTRFLILGLRVVAGQAVSQR
jgi:hypothetical protein